MTQFTAPSSVSQNIARAKSLAKRDEPIRALDALITALELFEPEKIIGKARFETEVAIQECVGEINRSPEVRGLLGRLTRSATAAVMYTPGEEAKLLPVLRVLRKALNETKAETARAAEAKAEDRKEMLLTKAKAALSAGEAPKGKAVLRRLADEFGTEPGVLAEIGVMLVRAKLPLDAVEFLEQALESFPKESSTYTELVTCYLELREFEKAEGLYLKAISQFGRHPRTLVNLGKLYLAWNKKDQAYTVLNQAVRMDPSNAEARELFAKLN